MGHGIQDLNSQNFDFIQDALYYTKGYMGYSRQERRRQTFAFRLRKGRARQRVEERQRDQRRRAGLPEIPKVVPRTEIRAYIAAIRPPLKPRTVFTKQWQDMMSRKWRQLLRRDPAMAELLELEKNGTALGTVPQLLLEELEASTDSLDLDKIHPIFSKVNMERSFLRTELDPMALHRARMNMRPALALATKFLTDPQLGDFWYHLMYGSPATDTATRKSYLATDPREADLKTARADWLALLDEMASRMQIHWHPTESRFVTHNDGCHSQHGFVNFLETFDDGFVKYRHRLRHPDADFNGVIGIGVHFLWHLLSPEREAGRSLEADLGVQFMLAITLVHELAHAVYSFRRLPFIVFQNKMTELHAYSTDFQNEIGEAFENHLWNGVLANGDMSHGSDCSLKVQTWEGWSLGSPSICTGVPESWLRDLFRKGTWENFPKHVDALPRPSGKERDFFAERSLDGVRFYRVPYENGKIASGVSEDIDRLIERFGKRLGKPRIRGDLQTWWKKVRDEEIALVLRGPAAWTYVVKPYWGPRLEILGNILARSQEYENRLAGNQVRKDEPEGRHENDSDSPINSDGSTPSDESTGGSADDQDEVAEELAKLSPAEDILLPYKHY